MLEELRIQVFVESVLELHVALSPIDLVTERYSSVWHQLYFVLARQINVDDLFAVVAYV